jgi:hypothetical protein
MMLAPRCNEHNNKEISRAKNCVARARCSKKTTVSSLGNTTEMPVAEWWSITSATMEWCRLCRRQRCTGSSRSPIPSFDPADSLQLLPPIKSMLTRSRAEAPSLGWMTYSRILVFTVMRFSRTRRNRAVVSNNDDESTSGQAKQGHGQQQ